MKNETCLSFLTRGGDLNGVFGDILPTLFLVGPSSNFNSNFHGSYQASGAEFGFFNFLDKALRPEL